MHVQRLSEPIDDSGGLAPLHDSLDGTPEPGQDLQWNGTYVKPVLGGQGGC